MSLCLTEQIMAEVAARIESEPLFAAVEVHVDADKNIVAEVQQRIAKLKRLVVPIINSASVLKPDVAGPYFDDINIDVGIFHNPKIAGDGPTIRAMAERVASLLHLWKPDSLSVPLKCSKDAISAVPDEKLNIWSVKASASGGLTYVLPQVADITATQDEDGVTLACATPGAAIFYTTDGRHPAPRNGTLFLEDIPIPAATNLKARAWLAGYLRSDLHKQTYNPV